MLPNAISWEAISRGETAFSLNSDNIPLGVIHQTNSALVSKLNTQHKHYKQLDRTTLLALNTVDNLKDLPPTIGVNFGSSRGATQTTEESIAEFNTHKRVNPSTSPNTTLGNISSWVGSHIGSSSVNLSHSIACSTGLHAILNSVAWLNSGMAKTMLSGASESPLTPYTIAQMQALKIHSKIKGNFPCLSMQWEKSENTMVLAEAASAFVLSHELQQKPEASIIGLGWGTETITHPANLSAQGICLQKSMAMALQSAQLKTVDTIIMHAPGTIKGDVSERNAIEQVFDKTPALTSNKWALGHSFATSGLLNVDMAIYMLKNQQWIANPLQVYKAPDQLKTIMVNAVGFGGNAVSIIVEIGSK